MSQVKKVKTTFEPLNDCIFEDAMLRKKDKSGFLCNMISDKDWKEEYTNFFLPQSELSVPPHIITQHLIPYIHEEKHMFFMKSDISNVVDNGAFLTVDKKGNIVRVKNVERNVCPERLATLWPLMKKTDDLKDACDSYGLGAVAYINHEEPKEEVERRFWIMVFGRAFYCSWYEFSGHKWLR